jgi:hypothetical protein
MTASPQRLSSAEIISEITQTRARLSRRLAVLDREYALRHLVVHVARFARHPESNAAAVGDTLGRDAVPLTLIAVGLGWLGFAGRSPDRALLRRVVSAIAALEQVAREFGLLPARVEPSSAAPSLPTNDGKPLDKTS